MSERFRRQFQSLYDALHPVGCERCWRVWERWLVPDEIEADWASLGDDRWRRVA